MLKKICKPSMLSLICAAVLFTGVCAVLGAGVNLGYIDYHPMKVIFQYIPNIL